MPLKNMLSDSLKNDIVATRHHIHQHPELGFEVHNTANFLAKKLYGLGLKVTTGIGQTGVIADLIVNPNYRMIAFRADMDALPIQEQSNKPYCSKIAGRAHMCGHDAHCAIAYGTAAALVQNKAQLKVNIRFIFQPSEEELPGGAPAMIADGALQGVSAIYGLHMMPILEQGKLKICEPVALSGVDLFDLRFTGIGGHAGTPYLANDPIMMASNFIQQLQTISSRNLNVFEPAVVYVSAIQSGSAYNVIPNHATLKGGLRYLDQTTRQRVHQRLHQLAEGIAHSFGGEATLSIAHGYPETRNHGEALEQAKSVAPQVFGDDSVEYSHIPWMASEDFSYYAQKVPACFAFLGSKNEEMGYTAMVHEPTFDLDDAIMFKGVEFFVAIAYASE